MTNMDSISKPTDTLDVLDIAVDWLSQGRRAALATVTHTWGSAPRPVGSHLLIDDQGNFEGSVSGGCVEAAVITEALDVIEREAVAFVEFGVADETAWRVGLSCGGRIGVRIEPLSSPSLASAIEGLAAAQRERKAAAIISSVNGSSAQLVYSPSEASYPTIADELTKRFVSGKSGSVKTESGHEFFLTVRIPKPQLVVIGAVHITQALVPMVGATGFDMMVIDPRTAFATPERFPDTQLKAEWPEDVFKNLSLDPYCAVIALTHDPKIDDYALISALQSDCFYIGALGSRKTHASRCERLEKAGVTPKQLARIHAPIGVNIGAANPAEIAVSVLAEIILALRGPKPEPKRAEAP
ncbi:XdhC family protein [Rhodobacteraceae bacterium RKSG542]|uniref:XdhC family protein n=1 Tax=Pseudovibrio flavus TaxID=2529854 RepID=UPI0012BCCF5D|nr:XdhC family protein [Pseudovibrio flavus]MTI17814.1 XdhC family protein [Pseudovibrio flavus]